MSLYQLGSDEKATQNLYCTMVVNIKTLYLPYVINCINNKVRVISLMASYSTGCLNLVSNFTSLSVRQFLKIPPYYNIWIQYVSFSLCLLLCIPCLYLLKALIDRKCPWIWKVCRNHPCLETHRLLQLHVVLLLNNYEFKWSLLSLLSIAVILAIVIY